MVSGAIVKKYIGDFLKGLETNNYLVLTNVFPCIQCYLELRYISKECLGESALSCRFVCCKSGYFLTWTFSRFGELPHVYS